MQSMNTRSLLVLGILVGVIVAGTGIASAQLATSTVDGPTPPQQTNATTTQPTTTANETNVSPGAHLSGMVGVQQVELDGEVDRRSFDRAFQARGSNESRARLIARNADSLEERLNELQVAREQLEAAVANDSISQGQYQSRAATLSARIGVLERQINQTSEAGRTIPPAVREQHGVNVTRLGHLQRAAGNLTGPEMAAIARTIAGPAHGAGPGMRGPPENVGAGPQGPPANQTGPASNGSQMPPRATESSSMGPDRMEPGPPNETTRAQPGPNSAPDRPAGPSNTSSERSSGSPGGPPTDNPSNAPTSD